jgi:rubrerythrin
MAKMKTNEQFLLELNKITTTIVPLEKYKGALEKIFVECTECGHQWYVQPHSLLQGKGCNVCSSIRGGSKQRKTHEQFVDELYEKYPNLTVDSPYTTMHDSVTFSCSVCNHTFERVAADIFYNGGCPICNVNNLPQRQPKELDTFLNDLYKKNKDIVYLDGYTKAYSKLHVRCKKCGHDWWAVGTSITAGVGCPSCNISHGEKHIKTYLCDNGIKFIPQKTFDGLVGVGGGKLSYDFYIPDFNLLIEFQGEFHDGTVPLQTEIAFLKQQEHDKRKREYACKHNIQLLEIWYYEYDHIDNILDDYLTKQNNLYYKIP